MTIMNMGQVHRPSLLESDWTYVDSTGLLRLLGVAYQCAKMNCKSIGLLSWNSALVTALVPETVGGGTDTYIENHNMLSRDFLATPISVLS